MLWIGIVYLAGVATFLTLAERAPVDHGNRFSDDEQSRSPTATAEDCRTGSASERLRR